MRRLVLALSASLLLAGAAQAQEEIPDPLPEETTTPVVETTETVVPLTPSVPTQPRQPDSLANQKFEAPRLTPADLVQANAAAKARQRRQRMAVSKWYGYSKSRPNLGQDIIIDYRFSTFGPVTARMMSTRPYVSGLSLPTLVR